jgi:hypothetical protein
LSKQDSFPSRDESIIERDSDTLLLFDTRTGTLYETNEVARQVWRMCDGRHSLNAISRALRSAYQRSDGIRHVDTDIDQFVSRLSKLRLVQLNYRNRAAESRSRKKLPDKSASCYRTPKVRKVWSDRTAPSGFLVEI